ncbi:MAG: fluoride efflux transporter CrcB [Campylobacterales bacterium]
MTNIVLIALVALGGALGAVGRHYVNIVAIEKLGTHFPYGILIVNSLGGFLILFFMTYFIDRLSIDPMWKLFVVTGFLGGFTTFSSFTYDTVMMLHDREFLKAFLNFFLNNLLAFVSGALGFVLARSI